MLCHRKQTTVRTFEIRLSYATQLNKCITYYVLCPAQFIRLYLGHTAFKINLSWLNKFSSYRAMCVCVVDNSIVSSSAAAILQSRYVKVFLYINVHVLRNPRQSRTNASPFMYRTYTQFGNHDACSTEGTSALRHLCNIPLK